MQWLCVKGGVAVADMGFECLEFDFEHIENFLIGDYDGNQIDRNRIRLIGYKARYLQQLIGEVKSELGDLLEINFFEEWKENYEAETKTETKN